MMDAITIAMAVGLVLGMLAGVLATWLVQRGTAQEDDYRCGWDDAQRDMLAHNGRPAWLAESDRRHTTISRGAP